MVVSKFGFLCSIVCYFDKYRVRFQFICSHFGCLFEIIASVSAFRLRWSRYTQLFPSHIAIFIWIDFTLFYSNLLLGWVKIFAIFCSLFKSFDDQIKSDKPKTVDSLTLLVIVANPKSSTRRVSGESCVLHDLSKSILSYRIVQHVTKILLNFWFTIVSWNKNYNLVDSNSQQWFPSLSC